MDTRGTAPLSTQEALERLKAGNRSYREASFNGGDISSGARAAVYEKGQHPFAAVITCSDSRVVPEHIFMAGVGELFTIRVAGNVVGPLELASVVYAVTHLRVPLVLVLGHTHCGAVGAVIAGGVRGSMAPITDVIASAIGDECDDRVASLLNVSSQVERLLASDEIAAYVENGSLGVSGALYRVEDGEVEFFE